MSRGWHASSYSGTSYRWDSSYVPVCGEYMHFKSPSHDVYDNFPDGTVVPSIETFVRFEDPVYVIDSHRAKMTRWHWGRHRYVRCEYVAIQFKVGARLLWTNYSRDGEYWMWTQNDMDLHESPTR